MSHLKDLKNARTLQDVAIILGFKPKSLAYILYKKPDVAKYKTFEIEKSSGGTRTIKAPYPELKLLQLRLSILLQNCIDEINNSRRINSAISHGFRRKHSIITNAVEHRNRRFVFNTDLNDFFGTINFGRVRGFFITNRNFILNPTVATILAQIACHNNSLPQGSPSSPVISNLIGHILDIRLAKLAMSCGCTYSRYVDDLTFSTNTPNFPIKIATLDGGEKPKWVVGEKLEKIINKAGFQINCSKTRMQFDGSRQVVTGLVVNKKVNPTSEYSRTARAMVHRLLKTGSFKHIHLGLDMNGNIETKEIDGTLDQLNGMLSFIDSISIYNRNKSLPKSAIKKHSSKPYESFDSKEAVYRKFLFYKHFYSASIPLVICEGKTDNIYLKAAIHKLSDVFPSMIDKEKDGKLKLKIKFFNYTNTTTRLLNLSGGTAQIIEFIKSYGKNCKKIETGGLINPVIILVDNDKGAKGIFSAVKSLTKTKATIDGTESFYHITHNLYLVTTPGEDTMIEDFFDQSVRDIQINGKKFNPSNDISDHKSEYGKYIFAEQVVKKHQDKIDFSGFTPILQRIEAVFVDYQNLLTSATAP